MRCFYPAFFLLSFLFFTTSVIAQDGERGVAVRQQSALQTAEITRAVVVGISTYKNLPASRQLEFADRDAELFSSYLQKSNITKELKLITNKDATAENILLNIDALLKKSASGDNLIIYFAGHGDVSKDITKDQDDAYLLCTNVATDADYSVSDAISLSMLQVIIAEAAAKNISVSLITDACRSGKVATSEQAAMSTAYLLSQKWNKVMKLASCQENELSYESAKWGNGHGVFTYYMVKGLIKEADDSPKDGHVTLKELELYLKRQVSEATEDSQNPIKVGGDAKRIFAKLLPTELLNEDGMLPPLRTMVASRSAQDEPQFEDARMANIYTRFKAQVKSGNLADSAYTAYTDFKQLDTAGNKADMLRNELVLALLSSGQRVLGKYLEGGNDMPSGAAFRKASAEFDLALTLYGEKNAMTRQWESKKWFLEAFSYLQDKRYEKYNYAIELLKKAKKRNKKAAYVYHGLGLLYGDLESYRLSEKYLLKAISLAPRWTYPKSDLGNTYFSMGRWDESIKQFDIALELDHNLARLYNNKSRIYLEQGKFGKSEALFLKADSIIPNTAVYIANLGGVYLQQGRLEAAEQKLQQAIKTDSTFGWAYKRLGEFYLYESKDHAKAQRALNYLTKAYEASPYYFENLNGLGNFYSKYDHNIQNVNKADSLFTKAIALNPHNRRGYYDLAILHLHNRKDTLAAKHVISGMMRNNRNNSEAMYYRGLYFSAIKNYKKAQKDFRKALNKSKYEKYAYTELAGIYERRKEFDKAEKYWLQALDVFKDSPEDLHKAGSFYLRISKPETAIHYFKKAIEADSSFSFAWSSLAYTLLNSTHQVDSAVYAFRKAYILNPNKHDLNEFSRLIRLKADAMSPVDTPASIIAPYYVAAASLAKDRKNELQFALANLYYLTGNIQEANIHLNQLHNPMSLDLNKMVNSLQWKIALQEKEYEKAAGILKAEMEAYPFPSYMGMALLHHLKDEKLKAKEYIELEKTENLQLLDLKYLKLHFNTYLLGEIEKLLH